MVVFKDAFHRFIINGETDAVNPARRGTKAGLHYQLRVPASKQVTVQLRLYAPTEASPYDGPRLPLLPTAVTCPVAAAQAAAPGGPPSDGAYRTPEMSPPRPAHGMSASLPPMSPASTGSPASSTASESPPKTPAMTPGTVDRFRRTVRAVQAAILMHPSRDGGESEYQRREPIGRRAKSDGDVHDGMVVEDACPKDVAANNSGYFGAWFGETFAQRIREADEFFASRLRCGLPPEMRLVQRQAYAGLLWSKQFYHYAVTEWLRGDALQPIPPSARLLGRNKGWGHLYNREVISMPDKWEYPWYASWDLAFHMLPMAVVDPHFAKSQLVLLLREWYMHPNGQIPAYEWALDDVNPPVHAWACWRVYKLTGPRGSRDRVFLARTFQKLLINFTWWVNRKDPAGNHVFSGGFLGLDNIGVFDRSKPLPLGGSLEQADGTSWMGFFCTTMLDIALELATTDPSYEDVASKFFEHFVQIADAMNRFEERGLWDEEDGFYYDYYRTEAGAVPLKVRSMVGLIPLFACLVLEPSRLAALPHFTRRAQWFIDHRPDLAEQISIFQSCTSGSHDPSQSDEFAAAMEQAAAAAQASHRTAPAPGGLHQQRRLLAVVSRSRLVRVFERLFDEDEFLGEYGIRSLSRVHEKHPFVFRMGDQEFNVGYIPGESTTRLFGGNSNWRGPVWLPVNFLLIEALERYHYFFGDTLTVEVPTRSGNHMNLLDASREIARRITGIFAPRSDGTRPCHADSAVHANPRDRDLVLFHEYFDPETGRGLGASHQTGWTALVARCIDKLFATHSSPDK